MAKIITFGELMLRLQPYNYERFVQCDHVEFTFGGGEANVAVSLANYGMDVAYVTKLPTHAIGQAAVNSLRRYGVDTSLITRGGNRVGIYFNEKGASQRPSVCIYDRAHSAISEATTADFDWDAIFEGVEWFHFTGITPALGANVVEICKEACKAAGVRFRFEQTVNSTVVVFGRPGSQVTVAGDDHNSEGKTACATNDGSWGAMLDSLGKSERKAMELAAANGSVSTSVLAEGAQITKRASSAALKRLAERGLLEWVGKSARDPKQFYRIPSDDHPAS